ncbi:hypothetical protein G6F47_009136 [Rhizopus delemar]|nr:hypothetical protein G6F54_007365 [Rhizopus delemar]KAG1593375.1 hypothetical protein G6F47_009136 [Rhizopus delemar]
MSNNKRVRLSISQKIELLDQNATGQLNQTELGEWAMKKFNLDQPLAQQTISNILKNAETLYSNVNVVKNSKSLKTTRYPQLDDEVLKFVADMKNNNLPVNRDSILRYVRQVAQVKYRIPEKEISFSSRWLTKLFKRIGVKCRPMHGESASVDTSSENIQNEFRKIEERLGPYDPVDIMNFDELGLYYQQSPRRTICSESLDGLKKELLTTLRHTSELSSTTMIYVRISLMYGLKTICDFEPVDYPTSTLPLEEKIVAELKGMLPNFPGKFDNKVTDVSQLNLEADESGMIVCYTANTTNNEETAEGNVDETEENDNTEQDEQCADIVECKKRLREAYETILMYEVLLDDLDHKLNRRIRMRLADSYAELNNSKEQTSGYCITINGTVEKIIKKQKTNHDDKEKIEEVDFKQKWVEFLADAERNKNFHRYSPEKDGVTRLGAKLSPHPNANKDVYRHLKKQLKPCEASSIWMEAKNYIDDIIAATNIDDFEENIETKAFAEDNKKICQYIKDICKIITIEKMESKPDKRKIYKADGIIRLAELGDLEVLVLETAGAFGNDDHAKESFDNSKGMFALLAMLETVAGHYKFAPIEEFRKLKLYFVQPSNKYIRLWSMQYAKHGLYNFVREKKILVGEDFEEREEHLASLVNFFMTLKSCLEETMKTIAVLKNQHKEKEKCGDSENSQEVLLTDIMELALASGSLLTDSTDVENQRDILLGYQNMGERIIAMAPDHSADLHSLASWVWTTTCRCSIQQGVYDR